MSKIKEIEVKIKTILFNGETVAFYKKQSVIIPFGGLPNEIVRLRVFKRKDYYLGQILTVVKPSFYRQNPHCEVFKNQGGCNFHHIKYPYQLRLKQFFLKKGLRSILKDKYSAKIVQKIIPSSPTLFYRNRGDLSYDLRTKSLGIKSRINKKFSSIKNHCLLRPEINNFLLFLQKKETLRKTHNVIIRYGVNTGDYLIQPAFKIRDLKTGQLNYRERILGKEFLISVSSFFQTNIFGLEKMIEIINRNLNQEDKIVVDAYAGVGTFSVFLADRTEKVIALEESQTAFKDAQFNLKHLRNVEYLPYKVENTLFKIKEKINLLIIDPSRGGCHFDVLKTIFEKKIKKVIYISCNLQTLIRDLKHFLENGYEISQVYPLDMFPQTHHLETIVILNK